MKKIKLCLFIILFSKSLLLADWRDNREEVDSNIDGTSAIKLVIDSKDTPNLFYLANSGLFKTAYKVQGNTSFEFLEGGPSPSSSLDFSIDIDKDDKIHFVYVTSDGSFKLEYGYIENRNWNTGQVIIDGGGTTFNEPDLVIGKPNNDEYVFLSFQYNSFLKYGSNISGPWYTEDASNESGGADDGKGSSIAFDDETGNVYISSFFDDVGQDWVECRKKLYTEDFQGWRNAGTTNLNNFASSLAKKTAIAVYNGKPFVSYINTSGTNVLYLARLNEHSGEWQHEVAGGSYKPLDGDDIEMEINSKGRIYIIYYDATITELRMSYFDSESNDWTHEKIDGNDAAHKFALAIDSLGNPHVAFIDDLGGVAYYTKKIFYTRPVVTITSPADNSNFYEGENVDFAATATDNEDEGILNAIQWISSIDGNIGTGPSINKADLSRGDHVITASFTDSDNDTGTASINLSILQSPVADELETESEIRVGNNRFDPDDPNSLGCNILFKVHEQQPVTIKVYDLTGKLLRVVAENQDTDPSRDIQSYLWDGFSDNGGSVPNGIYYIVVEGDGWKDERKVAIVKNRKK